jgi:hypothetical protein
MELPNILMFNVGLERQFSRAISSGVMPIFYQPTIRLTVNPVPAIFGRPPRIAGSLSRSVPISTTLAMASVYRQITAPLYQPPSPGG